MMDSEKKLFKREERSKLRHEKYASFMANACTTL